MEVTSTLADFQREHPGAIPALVRSPGAVYLVMVRHPATNRNTDNLPFIVGWYDYLMSAGIREATKGEA